MLVFICISGCKKTEYTEIKDMKDAIPYITSERVVEMAFCEKDPKGTTHDSFLVPPNAIGKTIDLIKGAKNREPQYMWEWTFVRIVTDKRKIIVLSQWDGEKVYFKSSYSTELRQYLKEQGLKEPVGEPNTPIDQHPPKFWPKDYGPKKS